jgi:hypothetical protein
MIFQKLIKCAAPAIYYPIFQTNLSTTFVVPRGVYRISVACVGGGGGGSRPSTTGALARGGGGGGGFAASNNISVVPGEVLTITVGVAGSNTGSGGTTTISRGGTPLVQASGGEGITGTTGGNGGSGLVGQILKTGQKGGSAVITTDQTVVRAGNGGNAANSYTTGDTAGTRLSSFTPGLGGTGLVFYENNYTNLSQSGQAGVTAGGGAGGATNSSTGAITGTTASGGRGIAVIIFNDENGNIRTFKEGNGFVTGINEF